MITVVVCDDFALARRRLVVMLEAQDDIDVAAEAADGDECIDACAGLGPDVVVIGMTVESIGGPATAAGVRELAPAAHVVMLATASDDADVVHAIHAGATGFINREFLDAAPGVIRAVAGGRVVLPPLIVQHLVAELAAADDLEPREQVVLQRLGQGANYADIAGEMELGDFTVKNLAANAVEKVYRHHRTMSLLAAAPRRTPQA